MYRSFPKGRRALTGQINRQPRFSVKLSDLMIAASALALLGVGGWALVSHISGEADGLAALQNLWRVT